ncbi:MAG: formimidoylglutamate deiminase [Rhodobacteraceae bacterium]|nr:formimidoylglutamate deiminase [Paracoccaceae bacterium]
MKTIHAKSVLLPTGWAQDITVTIALDGRIDTVADAGSGAAAGATSVDILLPAPCNVHSHAFQRAMAGLSEQRGPVGRDSFWTWRQLMYRFLDRLTPEDIQAITAQVQMEMLESGYAAVGEFHYLHHQPGGRLYDDLGELSNRICAAAEQTGIGLTLLPVLYQQGGVDGRDLGPGQIRFGNDPERFFELLDRAATAITSLPDDTVLGAAPHSLRAVTPEALKMLAETTKGPLHMHLAEQVDEVSEIKAAYGARPVQWLLDTQPPDVRWCLIHCTQMLPDETTALATTGAVAGLCPITEASLGDGIFDAERWLSGSGRMAIGSDSNIRISLTEELRQLEYSQRLRDKGRAVLAEPGGSTARRLYDAAVSGGAQAMGRKSGAIASGFYADLVALDGDATDLIGRQGDTALDTWVFTAGNELVCDVWSAGRHMVQNGRHVFRHEITQSYRDCLSRLAEVM